MPFITGQFHSVPSPFPVATTINDINSFGHLSTPRAIVPHASGPLLLLKFLNQNHCDLSRSLPGSSLAPFPQRNHQIS